MRLSRGQLVKQLPQLGARILQRVRVVAPIAPAPRNRKKRGVHRTDTSQVLEDLRVFVVLNSVADGLQANSRCGLGRSDRCWRIDEDSVTRPAQSSATSGRVHVVPAADGVAGSPAVSAIIQQSRRALREVEESRLDTLVDWWIVHHPLWGVSVARIAARIAPEVPARREGQQRALLQGSR